MNVTLEIMEELRKDGDRHAKLERSEHHNTIVYLEPYYNDLSVRRQDVFQLKDHVAYIRRLAEQGGPRECDFPKLDYWIIDVHTALQAGKLSDFELAEIRTAFGDALSPSTVHLPQFSARHPSSSAAIDPASSTPPGIALLVSGGYDEPRQ